MVRTSEDLGGVGVGGGGGGGLYTNRRANGLRPDYPKRYMYRHRACERQHAETTTWEPNLTEFSSCFVNAPREKLLSRELDSSPPDRFIFCETGSDRIAIFFVLGAVVVVLVVVVQRGAMGVS